MGHRTRFSGTVTLRREASTFLILQAAPQNLCVANTTEMEPCSGSHLQVGGDNSSPWGTGTLLGWTGHIAAPLGRANGAILSDQCCFISTKAQDYPAGTFFWSGNSALMSFKSHMLVMNHTLDASVSFC